MAIEIIDKLKPKNGANFKIIDSNDVEYINGKNIKDEITNLISKDLEIDEELVDILNKVNYKNYSVHIGVEAPNDENIVWVDTMYNNIDDSLNSVIIDEFRNIFSYMKNRIDSLEKEISDIKNNIGNSGTVYDYLIMTEDNAIITCENGDIITLEKIA